MVEGVQKYKLNEMDSAAADSLRSLGWILSGHGELVGLSTINLVFTLSADASMPFITGPLKLISFYGGSSFPSSLKMLLKCLHFISAFTCLSHVEVPFSSCKSSTQCLVFILDWE